MNSSSENPRIGVWLIGARGSVATCVAYGLAGLREGLLEPVAVTTEHEPLAGLPLVELEDIELAGWDVTRRSLTDAAGELVRAGVLDAELVAASSNEAAAYAARLRPGILDDAEVGLGDVDPDAARLGTLPPREQIEALRGDLAAFARDGGLDRVIVVNLASTEPLYGDREEWNDLASFEAALDSGRSLPPSVVYAYAALGAGHPFVNFTPSRGASIPALAEFALQQGVPHCGNDGKTGETLLKTVLAPMFRARALRVLAWQGYNMLGNRDGEVLADPLHKEAKVRGKDAALRSILDDEDVHTHVGIDYVPSLHDWKTAWDFVHFEGFLGTKMSLQFTWSGCDSALAAPLVIDLVRLVDFAARNGEKGVLAHLACYFKDPLSGGAPDFHLQHRTLLEYAERHATP